MDRLGILRPFRKWECFPSVFKHRDGNIIFNYWIFFFIFFYRLNIILSRQQKYGQTGKFKAFQIMRLLPIDIQTQSRRKNCFRFSIFFLVFFNRLNIIRSSRQKYGKIGNFKNFQEIDLFPTHIQTEPKKIISDFLYFTLFFSTDLILSDQADKNMDRQGISRPFRIWAYFPPISKHRAEKNYFRFSILCFFFNRFNIIRSSRQKYGQIGNFKAIQKMGLLPIDIQTQRREYYFRLLDI